MRRHEIGRMVGRLWIDVVSARRLDPDNHIAIATERKMKLVSIAHRIVIRRTPSFGDGIAHRLRKRGEMRPICCQRQTDIAYAALPAGIGRPRLQLGDQRRAVLRRASDAIPSIGKRAHGGEDAFRRVQPNTVCQPPVTVRVIGHDQRYPPVPGAGFEAAPIPQPVSPQRPHVRERLHMMSSWHGSGMAARRRLEPDGAGQQTPIEFRKGDIHRQVTRRQAGT